MKHFSSTITKKLRKTGDKTGGGCFGQYFKLDNKRGIKLLRRKFDSSEKAQLSETFHKAKLEELSLNMARERVSFVPKCYGVKVVKFRGNFRVGVIMQHLNGITLEKLGYNRDKRGVGDFGGDFEDDVVEMMDNRMLKVGINHGDVHGGNIIYHAKRYWVIDFGNEVLFKTPRGLDKKK